MKLNEKIRTTKLRLSSIGTKVEWFSKVMPDLERCENIDEHFGGKVTELGAKVQAIENRNRQNNLVIYGVAGDSMETPTLLNKKGVSDVFDARLGLKVELTVKIH